MPIGKLSSLQERVLRLLADIEPPWTLTGGAALAGFHTHHRATRDLDLFFRPQAALGTVVGAVREHLERDGLNVAGFDVGNAAAIEMGCSVAVMLSPL